MTQRSKFWNGITTGDALEAPYDAPTEFAAVTRDLSVIGGTVNLSGVFRRILNELAPTVGVGAISVNTGRAMVHGSWYESDGVVSLLVPTPAGATRFGRVVLRKDWTLQTVRLITLEGVEGGIAPALTQIAGSIWEMNICLYSITTAGTITLLTDERNFIPHIVNPAVQVFNTASPLMPASSVQLVLQWNTQLFITDASMHNVSVNNTRLVAPRTGLYDIFGSVKFFVQAGGAARTSTVALRKNGVTYFYIMSAYSALGVSIVIPIATKEVLAAGEYIETIVHQNSADAVSDISSIPYENPKFGMRWLQPAVGY